MYAVRRGRTVGVFDTYEQVKRVVTGYAGAQHKSFLNEADAYAYLLEGGLCLNADGSVSQSNVLLHESNVLDDPCVTGQGPSAVPVTTLNPQEAHDHAQLLIEGLKARSHIPLQLTAPINPHDLYQLVGMHRLAHATSAGTCC